VYFLFSFFKTSFLFLYSSKASLFNFLCSIGVLLSKYLCNGLSSKLLIYVREKQIKKSIWDFKHTDFDLDKKESDLSFNVNDCDIDKKEKKKGEGGGGGGGRDIICCKQCSFLVNFRLKYKDINKSNKRQTYNADLSFT
jgi:hypothetical protein